MYGKLGDGDCLGSMFRWWKRLGLEHSKKKIKRKRKKKEKRLGYSSLVGYGGDERLERR